MTETFTLRFSGSWEGRAQCEACPTRGNLPAWNFPILNIFLLWIQTPGLPPQTHMLPRTATGTSVYMSGYITMPKQTRKQARARQPGEG